MKNLVKVILVPKRTKTGIENLNVTVTLIVKEKLDQGILIGLEKEDQRRKMNQILIGI